MYKSFPIELKLSVGRRKLPGCLHNGFQNAHSRHPFPVLSLTTDIG